MPSSSRIVWVIFGCVWFLVVGLIWRFVAGLEPGSLPFQMWYYMIRRLKPFILLASVLTLGALLAVLWKRAHPSIKDVLELCLSLNWPFLMLIWALINVLLLGSSYESISAMKLESRQGNGFFLAIPWLSLLAVTPMILLLAKLARPEATKQGFGAIAAVACLAALCFLMAVVLLR
ncbi:MAG: hypothetical protein KDC35_11695 [Acidobacteria bacterium]|nr:hypothetical protein [Acidobacteriota bacterium]